MTCRQARDAMLILLTGRMSPDERRPLLDHLAACPTCAREADTLGAVVAGLRSAPEPEPPPDFWPVFMTQLEARVRAEALPLGARLRRWFASPSRVAWTAAATVALVVVMAAAALQPAPPPAATPQTQVAPFLTEGMKTALPALSETIRLWQAGLGPADAEALTGPEGR